MATATNNQHSNCSARCSDWFPEPMVDSMIEPDFNSTQHLYSMLEHLRHSNLDLPLVGFEHLAQVGYFPG